MRMAEHRVPDGVAGSLVRHHDRPLSLPLQLTPEKVAVCRSAPANIALLHNGSLGS